MRKIPTLFVRDPDDRSRVLDEVTPGCEWVFAGEGVATRKYDGTCVRLTNDGMWWARREVKAGKDAPSDFVPVEIDEVTGKVFGWEPIERSGFAKFHAEAVRGDEAPGSYELCGPRVNGNPEGYDRHVLVRHGAVVLRSPESDLTFDGLRDYLTGPDWRGEGIVWHHPDGRMAKLKKRDFRA